MHWEQSSQGNSSYFVTKQWQRSKYLILNSETILNGYKLEQNFALRGKTEQQLCQMGKTKEKKNVRNSVILK